MADTEARAAPATSPNWRCGARVSYIFVAALRRLLRMMKVDRIVLRLLPSYELQTVCMLLCFITAHEEAQNEMRKFFFMETRVGKFNGEAEELSQGSAEPSRSRSDPLREEEDARAYLADLSDAVGIQKGGGIAEISEAIRARSTASVLLHRVELFLRQMAEHGILDPREADSLLHPLEHDHNQLTEALVKQAGVPDRIKEEDRNLGALSVERKFEEINNMHRRRWKEILNASKAVTHCRDTEASKTSCQGPSNTKSSPSLSSSSSKTTSPAPAKPISLRAAVLSAKSAKRLFKVHHNPMAENVSAVDLDFANTPKIKSNPTDLRSSHLQCNDRGSLVSFHTSSSIQEEADGDDGPLSAQVQV